MEEKELKERVVNARIVWLQRAREIERLEKELLQKQRDLLAVVYKHNRLEGRLIETDLATLYKELGIE